ncbi:sodium- and chloride-dependent GABA transporter ine isoform X2 [Armigeres subalbatus]|uniref:sodium- and chloride-dependent GABA transporter ine isoform X2 n=1 Tax=Armigeres subalbatus TaxID=124917 RepID=UPI002ED153E7
MANMDRKLKVHIQGGDSKQNGAPKLIHYGHMEDVEDLFPLTNAVGSYPNSPILTRKYFSKLPPDEPYDNDSYTGISDDSDIDNLKPRKQHWANKMQFVLACIGYSVGLGNVWRFPYLCYKSGGGTFWAKFESDADKRNPVPIRHGKHKAASHQEFGVTCMVDFYHRNRQSVALYTGISDDSDIDNLKPRKQHWANKMQFVLACIGYSVGLGNVWRFPYLCYKSGGGVFLVPYFIILLFCGIPMLFMELAVGQYTGRGPIGALGQLCPLLKGTGLASVVVSFLMSTYYSVIIAYAIYYFFTSFRPDLPWTDCSHRWNTPDCWVPERMKHNISRPEMSRTPTEEFFENKVLQISHGIEYPGGMRWELVACLICAWILVYFAIWKSIKSSAKVRYLTATLPFVLIIVFLGRSLTLEGADKGLNYFFRPNWEELGRANVWINAAAQNFNSIGIAFGSMISFASYNKYNNNILHDTLAVSFVNGITSLLVGIFAFATIGNIALEQNTTVEDVISGGPGLIFVVYPQALAKMPAAQMWAVLFFFMLLCLGLNSQFAIVEVVVTSIQDGFPRWIKRKLVYHELLVLIVCVVSFFAGLPNLIQGGIYFFQLIDHYAASISIMFLAFFETVAIAWFYGINRLSKNVKQMTGRYPSFYLRFCLLIAVPAMLISLWIFSLINYEAPTYHNGKYIYPGWAHGLGWAITGASLICIPAFAIYQIARAEGATIGQKFMNTLKPNLYECKVCGEHHCDHEFPEEEYGREMALVDSTSGAPLILQAPPLGNQQVTVNGDRNLPTGRSSPRPEETGRR